MNHALILIEVLLAAENPSTVATPLLAEPDPGLNPLAVVPVDVGDVVGTVRAAPVREDQGDVATERGRDLVLVLQDVLPIVLTGMSRQLLGPLDHGVANDRLLVPPEVAEEVIDPTTDLHHRRGRILDELLNERPNRVGVVGADQDSEQPVSELPLQVSHRPKRIHHCFPCLLFRESMLLAEIGKKEDRYSYPTFLLLYFIYLK